MPKETLMLSAFLETIGTLGILASIVANISASCRVRKENSTPGDSASRS